MAAFSDEVQNNIVLGFIIIVENTTLLAVVAVLLNLFSDQIPFLLNIFISVIF